MLRIENKQASLEELGQMHEPPLTKDAVAGRIRRLLATADKRATELGIPNTEASLSADMLDEEIACNQALTTSKSGRHGCRRSSLRWSCGPDAVGP